MGQYQASKSLQSGRLVPEAPLAGGDEFLPGAAPS